MKKLVCMLLLVSCIIPVFACLEDSGAQAPEFSKEAIPEAQPDVPRDLPVPEERYCASQKFGIRNGPRDAKRVAITVDDCFDKEMLRDIFDLVKQYNIRITIFPLGDQLRIGDRDLWREIAASNCEIGSHTMHHTNMTHMGRNDIHTHLYRFQETLDETLGYHYGVVSLRPPYGAYQGKDNVSTRTVMNTCKAFGFEHVVLWDVSQTNAKKAKKQVKNGSILLYHTRAKDYQCLQELIPWLLEQGYELVTVRELLEFDPIETGPELYVYQK